MTCDVIVNTTRSSNSNRPIQLFKKGDRTTKKHEE